MNLAYSIAGDALYHLLTYFINPSKYSPTSQLQSLADRKVRLVPIRLDLTIDDVKLRDAFTWNLNGKFLPSSFSIPHNQFSSCPY